MQSLTGKTPGTQLTAAEWNQLPQEVQNIITDLGITLSSGDVDQLGKAIAGFLASGDFYSESGVADAYVVSPIGSRQGPAALLDGMMVRFRPGNANTGASTINVNSLGVKTISREDSETLSANDLVATRDAYLRFSSGSDEFRLSRWSSQETQGSPANLKIGHLVRTDGGTITLSAGTNDNIVMTVNGKILTRSADLTFDFGDLDTGGEAASTAYYLYIDDIAGVMTAVVSVTAPILPGAVGKIGYHPTRTDELCIGGFWNDVGSDIVPTRWGPDGEVYFTEHDADHVFALTVTATTVWRNQVVNLPETASAVSISSAARHNPGSFMIIFGMDGASGTGFTGIDITNVVYFEVLLHSMGFETNNQGNLSVHGNIPIGISATPAIAYASIGSTTQFDMIVRGYIDFFTPKI